MNNIQIITITKQKHWIPFLKKDGISNAVQRLLWVKHSVRTTNIRQELLLTEHAGCQLFVECLH